MTQKPAKDRAAALVTVLTMLAIMSALAIVVVDAANMSMRSTANLVRTEQTRWYLMGAETFAVGKIEDLRRRAETADIDQEEWQNRVFTFPLDDGIMEVMLSDGANCFNLNSMVETQDSGLRQASARGMVQLARLMDFVDVRSDRGGLAASLADWIDSDTLPGAGGFEDGAFGEGVYRTANSLIADLSELRSVRGFNDEIVARLAPFVCVRPTSAPNLFNPNTLTPEQAPLLAMAISDLTLEAARQVIRDRPRGGWEDIDHFFAHPRLSTLNVSEPTRAQFSMRSSYYILRARVERDGARETSAALIAAHPGVGAVVLRRVFGAGASENAL